MKVRIKNQYLRRSLFVTLVHRLRGRKSSSPIRTTSSAGFGLELEQVEPTAQDAAQVYLEEGQLTLHSDRRIGAVQGPNYAETMLYRFDAHEDNDRTKPLLPEYQSRQQYEVQAHEEGLKLLRLPQVKSSKASAHVKNMGLDFDLSQLTLSTQEALKRDAVDLDFEPEHMFDYELSPRFDIFKESKKQQRRTHNI